MEEQGGFRVRTEAVKVCGLDHRLMLGFPRYCLQTPALRKELHLIKEPRWGWPGCFKCRVPTRPQGTLPSGVSSSMA